MAAFKDITGKVFGRLTASHKVGKTDNGETIWRLSCICGGTKDVPIGRLTSGQTQSCGCLAAEILKARSVTHGMTGTPEHSSWMYMNQRCESTSDDKLRYYGDVEVQENWKTDFSAFLNHIGEQPKDGERYTVDRIDNSIGYFEGNVRWLTQTKQARNKTLQTRSATGVTGVTLAKSNRRGWEELRYMAITNDLNGKRQQKSFSVRKYGLMPAFHMACVCRKEMIVELNEQGACYSDKHGL